MRSWFARRGRFHAAAGTVTAVFLSLSGCSETPTDQDCTRLLDRLIELEIEAAGTDELSAEMRADLDTQRKQLTEHMATTFVDTCKSTMPVSVVRCGLEAKTIAEYAQCEKR